MNRYIYDEVKKEFYDEGYVVSPALITRCMANVVHEMGYKAPGMIPECRLEEFKSKVKIHVRRCIVRIGTGMEWLNSISRLGRS